MSISNIALPKYEVVLPVSKISVTYRPFTVKEEKLLLIAQEEGSVDDVIRAIGQIVENCTFGKQTIDSLNKIDAEYLFIQLRNKSMGEGVEVNGICSNCEVKTPMTLNLMDIQVSNLDKKLSTIELMDGMWVTMKYPSFRDALIIAESDGTTALALSVDTIVEGEDSKNASDYSKEELIEFIESLTSLQLAKFKEFFDNFPVITYDKKFTCKCGHVNTIHIEGIENFFG